MLVTAVKNCYCRRMKRLLLSFAFATSACVTSYQGLERREVVATYHTSRPRAEVAACLVEGLSRQGAPLIVEREGNTVVTFNYQGSTDLMITLTPAGEVLVRRAQVGQIYREGVERCI